MSNKLKIIIGALIVLITVALFAKYLSDHSYLLTRLAHTSPVTIIFILLLNVAMLGALALILQASLRICRKTIPDQENVRLNAYSLLTNFFVLGQSGPGVRALYLKKRHKLPIRRFIFVTLVYYACYAVISVLLVLLGSSMPLWLSGLIVLATIGGCVMVVGLYTRRTKFSKDGLNLSLSSVGYLALVTLIQAVVQVSIYMIELHSVGAHANLRQALAYTGVANLALFVGLTPGAIGIRESFLIFSNRILHLSSAIIVTANIIDRSVFLLFLGLLFLVLISLHVKSKVPSLNSRVTLRSKLEDNI